MFGKSGEKRKYRQQRAKGFPIGLLASATTTILAEVTKPILKTSFGIRKKKRR